MRYSTFALLAGPSVLALEWPGPTPTPHGLMAQAGKSPRPTAAPELRGLPRALMRRQKSQLPNPPPASWCGFVTGNPAQPLECNFDEECQYIDSIVGCYDPLIDSATFYSTCYNYNDECGNACLLDDLALNCDVVSPYCGEYAFASGTRNYVCNTVAHRTQSVEFLADYYAKNLGITLGDGAAATSVFFAAASSFVVDEVSSQAAAASSNLAVLSSSAASESSYLAALTSAAVAASISDEAAQSSEAAYYSSIFNTNPYTVPDRTATGIQEPTRTAAPIAAATATKKSRLSPGAIVGIVFGSLLVPSAFAAWYLRRRKQMVKFLGYFKRPKTDNGEEGEARGGGIEVDIAKKVMTTAAVAGASAVMNASGAPIDTDGITAVAKGAKLLFNALSDEKGEKGDGTMVTETSVPPDMTPITEKPDPSDQQDQEQQQDQQQQEQQAAMQQAALQQNILQQYALQQQSLEQQQQQQYPARHDTLQQHALQQYTLQQQVQAQAQAHAQTQRQAHVQQIQQSQAQQQQQQQEQEAMQQGALQQQFLQQYASYELAQAQAQAEAENQAHLQQQDAVQQDEQKFLHQDIMQQDAQQLLQQDAMQQDEQQFLQQYASQQLAQAQSQAQLQAQAKSQDQLNLFPTPPLSPTDRTDRPLSLALDDYAISPATAYDESEQTYTYTVPSELYSTPPEETTRQVSTQSYSTTQHTSSQSSAHHTSQSYTNIPPTNPMAPTHPMTPSHHHTSSRSRSYSSSIPSPLSRPPSTPGENPQSAQPPVPNVAEAPGSSFWGRVTRKPVRAGAGEDGTQGRAEMDGSGSGSGNGRKSGESGKR